MHENKPIPMYGDGSSKRNYTYVEDIVDGTINALNALNGYKIYNIGGEETTSLKDLIQMLCKQMNKKPIIEKLPMQAGDLLLTYADISKASVELSYEPKVKIQEGLKKFIDWFFALH